MKLSKKGIVCLFTCMYLTLAERLKRKDTVICMYCEKEGDLPSVMKKAAGNI